MTRLEELPSGKRVLYVDIGNLSVEERNEYITQVRNSIMSQGDIHYAIPIMSTKNSKKFDLETFLFKMLMLVAAFNIIGVLFQIIKCR